MMAALRRRLTLPCAVATAFLVAAGLWLSGAHTAYHTLLDAWMLDSFRFPFLDTHAVLSAIECSRRGFDVYTVNPCDVLGRVHVYGPLWLRLSSLPATTSWTDAAGIAIAVSFCISLAALPPPRGRGGTALMLLAALSPSTVFAVERGNIDLVIFILAAICGRLALSSRPAARHFSSILVAVAAALKFYPLSLLLLVMREDLRRCLIFGALAITVLAALLLPQAAQVVRALHVVPHSSPFVGSFGAGNVSEGLSILFALPPLVGPLLTGALVLRAAIESCRVATRVQKPLNKLSQEEQIFLLIGGALFVGCFLVGQSIQYRAVVLLFALPAMIGLAFERQAVGMVAVGSAILVMWKLPLWGLAAPLGGHVQALLWLLSELGWWSVQVCLSAMLIAFLRESAAWQDAVGFLKRDFEAQSGSPRRWWVRPTLTS